MADEPLQVCVRQCGSGKLPRDRAHFSIRHGEVSQLCRACHNKEQEARRLRRKEVKPAEPAFAEDPRLNELVKLARRGPISRWELLTALDCAPSQLETLLKDAVARHIHLELTPDRVSLPPSAERLDVQDAEVAPVVGQPIRVGVLSDTHAGSKYCLRPQLKDSIQWMYDLGVRLILHCGDAVDGCYKHGRFELTHHGLDDQTDDLFEILLQKPGLRYFAIGGNHDETFTADTGVDTGEHVTARFMRYGRNDLRFIGTRGAYLNIAGTLFHLWHPGKGTAYALSYKLQKQVENYAPGNKHLVLLAGHWHRYCHITPRGVQAFSCCAFQGSGSAFSKSLGGSPDLGCMIIEYSLTADGTIRELFDRRRTYFEREVRRDPDEVFNGALVIPSYEGRQEKKP